LWTEYVQVPAMDDSRWIILEMRSSHRVDTWTTISLERSVFELKFVS